MLLSPADARRLHEKLLGLFADQMARGHDPYLAVHGLPSTIKQHVNTFCWYAAHLPSAGVFLDWGCHYGPDSVLLRETFGEGIEIHASDFHPDSQFQAFREFSRPRYVQLQDSVKLPYADATFDAVMGAGVLEHTALEYESLKEVYRVLKPGGVLVITYLPYYL